MATQSLVVDVAPDNCDPRLIPSPDPRVQRFAEAPLNEDLSFDLWQFQAGNKTSSFASDGHCVPPPAFKLRLAELFGQDFALTATPANLRRLPRRQALAFRRFYWASATHREIGAEMGVTPEVSWNCSAPFRRRVAQVEPVSESSNFMSVVAVAVNVLRKKAGQTSGDCKMRKEVSRAEAALKILSAGDLKVLLDCRAKEFLNCPNGTPGFTFDDVRAVAQELDRRRVKWE